MKKEIWYEVFEDLGEYEGTQTRESFTNLKRAKQYLKTLRAIEKGRFHVDKWTYINGEPENIEAID